MAKKYSGKRVIKAGDELKGLSGTQSDAEFQETFDVLSYWRYNHEKPLESALALTKEIILKKDKTAIFAKRLKRHVSIFRKLIRFEKMNLKNMQDIGGCRAVVTSEKKLSRLLESYERSQSFEQKMVPIDLKTTSKPQKKMDTEVITLSRSLKIRR